MQIQKALFVFGVLSFSFFVHTSACAKALTKERANLYVSFQNGKFPQQVVIKVKDQGRPTSIKCKSTKPKSGDKPSCGFGFMDQSVSIIQLRYQAKDNSSRLICPELNGKQFEHAKLIISTDGKPTCNLETINK